MTLINKPTDDQINKIEELFRLIKQGKLTEQEYIQAIKENSKRPIKYL